MPAKVYTDKDADLSVLKNKTLAVLGFGSQGHAHALNLKESGFKVIIGLYEGSKSIPVAQEKGFEVVSTAEAVKRANVIMVALPDTKPVSYTHLDVYKRQILHELIHIVFGQLVAFHIKRVENQLAFDKCLKTVVERVIVFLL